MQNFEIFRDMARSGEPLHFSVTAGSIEVTAGSASLEVPNAVSARSNLLQNAPDGAFTDVDGSLAFWLECAWRRYGEEENEQWSIYCAQDADDEDVQNTFSLLSACAFVQDELGLEDCCQRAFSLVLTCRTQEAPDELHVHTAPFTKLSCELPVRILESLPPDLARRVLEHGPLEVLDRLPLDSDLAAVACALHNERARAWESSGPRGMCADDSSSPDFFMRFHLSDSCRWQWRAHVAERLGVQLRVQATFLDLYEFDNVLLRPGIHVSDVSLDPDTYREFLGEACEPLNQIVSSYSRFPSRVESLGLQSVKLYKLRSVRLPATLRKLHISTVSSSMPDYLADVSLPLSLGELHVTLRNFDFRGWVELPQRLTSLTLALSSSRIQSMASPPSLRGLQLPACLQSLSVSGAPLAQLDCNWQLADLPPTLRRLSFDSSGMGAEAVPALERLTLLEELGLGSVGSALGSALAVAKLSAKLVKLSFTEANLDGTTQDSSIYDHLRGALARREGLHGASFKHRWQLGPLPSSVRALEMGYEDLCRGAKNRWRLPEGLQVLVLDCLGSMHNACKGGAFANAQVCWPRSLRFAFVLCPKQIDGLEPLCCYHLRHVPCLAPCLQNHRPESLCFGFASDTVARWRAVDDHIRSFESVHMMSRTNFMLLKRDRLLLDEAGRSFLSTFNVLDRMEYDEMDFW